jgi:hypothetical protein
MLWSEDGWLRKSQEKKYEGKIVTNLWFIGMRGYRDELGMCGLQVCSPIKRWEIHSHTSY